MMLPGYRIAPIALAVAGLCASAAALAGLKAKPPEGVTLAGIEWQLDKYNSDNPSEAIDRAGRRQPTISNRPAQDDDDPFGRNSPTHDPIGRRTPGPLDRATPGGGWGRGGGNSADVDPIGNQSVQMTFGSTTRGSLFFEALRKNPEKLSFSEGKQYVTVNEDGLETECEAGTKAPFSDSYGDGQRECGWSGRTWVIETTRPRQFKRTDRYELSKDGKTLKYTTSASEEGVGRVTISRRYQLPPNK
jgi:hypothetical protein